MGARFAIEWRSRLPYPLEFEFTVERVERPFSMGGSAVGELSGRGVWRLFEEAGVTAVVYDWQVATTKRWMNLLSPIARPVFEYNHDVVMRWGGEGLARARSAWSCWRAASPSRPALRASSSPAARTGTA